MRRQFLCAVARVGERAGFHLLQESIDSGLLEVSTEWSELGCEQWVRPCESPSGAAAAAASAATPWPRLENNFQCLWCCRPIVNGQKRCRDCIERAQIESWQMHADRHKPLHPLPKKIQERGFTVSKKVFTDFCRNVNTGPGCELPFCPFMHRWDDSGKSCGHIFRDNMPKEYIGRKVCHYELTLGRGLCKLRDSCPFSHDVESIRPKLKELRSAYRDNNSLCFRDWRAAYLPAGPRSWRSTMPLNRDILVRIQTRGASASLHEAARRVRSDW